VAHPANVAKLLAHRDARERWEWQRVGVIEDFAATPDGRLASTTYLTKRL
jgi:hypothetical protein